MPEPKEFVKNLLKARKWAGQHGMVLGYAGSRLADHHHQFCPILQKNLTITPEGLATACFLVSHNQGPQNESYIFGSCSDKQDGMIVNRKKLDRMLTLLSRIHEQCSMCFNRTHCAKGCPSICPLQSGLDNQASFDCTMEKWIGLANLIEAAGMELPEEATEDPDLFFGGIKVEPAAEWYDHE
jgi:radical SAM protein with 4Fe4S-binding SPASM domain